MTTASYTDQGLRDKVGASHLPLASLLNDVLAAGFTVSQFQEGGPVTPMTLSFRAHASHG